MNDQKSEKLSLLMPVGLILTVILFIYVVVLGGILKGIIVILCTIVLSPLILSAYFYSETKNQTKPSGSIAGLGMLAPFYLSAIAVVTSVILTIIMAIYIFISNFTTPTPSTIV